METDKAAFVSVYHPSGAKVSVPLPVDGSILDEDAVHALFRSVSGLLAGGFTVNAPEATEGEIIETMGWVLAKKIQRRDGGEVYALAMYIDNDALLYSKLTVYLDTPEMERQFEHVSGVRLSTLPVYDGDGRLARDSKAADKYIRRVARPFRLAFVKNPLYNPDEPDMSKRKPQYKFTRFVDAEPAPATPETPARTAHDAMRNAFPDADVSEIAPQPSGKPWNAQAVSAWKALYPHLSDEELFKALDVTRYGEWKGDAGSATLRVNWYLGQQTEGGAE